MRSWNPYAFADTKLFLLILICLLLLICAAVWRLPGVTDKNRILSRILLVFWIFTILSATFLGRDSTSAGRANLHLFWTIRRAWNTHSGLHWYFIIGNIALFVPLGFLNAASWKPLRSWWKIMLTGFLFSAAIEITQYVTLLGLCEADDMMHNTFGAFLGYQLYTGVQYLFRTYGNAGKNVSVIERQYEYHRKQQGKAALLFIGFVVLLFLLMIAVNNPDWSQVSLF